MCCASALMPANPTPHLPSLPPLVLRGYADSHSDSKDSAIPGVKTLEQQLADPAAGKWLTPTFTSLLGSAWSRTAAGTSIS